MTAFGPEDLTFRSFDRPEDYHACAELQRVIWGRDFSDVVPSSILKISQKVGGIAAGAFAPDGSLLGFVWGLSGVRADRPFHWSHMLGVHPDARDLRLGTRLKLLQRDLLIPEGIEDVEWTYDPLEARNAHLNLNHLGAQVIEYIEDMYAGEMGSDLAQGIGTDRFIVRWRIASQRVADILTGSSSDPRDDPARFADTPVVGLEAAEEGSPLPAPQDAPRVRVEIPADVQAVKAERPDEAMAWRLSTRRAFEHYFEQGCRVTAYLREGDRRFYGVEKP